MTGSKTPFSFRNLRPGMRSSVTGLYLAASFCIGVGLSLIDAHQHGSIPKIESAERDGKSRDRLSLTGSQKCGLTVRPLRPLPAACQCILVLSVTFLTKGFRSMRAAFYTLVYPHIYARVFTRSCVQEPRHTFRRCAAYSQLLIRNTHSPHAIPFKTLALNVLRRSREQAWQHSTRPDLNQ